MTDNDLFEIERKKMISQYPQLKEPKTEEDQKLLMALNDGFDYACNMFLTRLEKQLGIK